MMRVLIDELDGISPMEVVHGVLDVIGLIPGAGDLADGVNAFLYAAEGEWSDAALSLAACLPAAGSVLAGTLKHGDELAAGLKKGIGTAEQLKTESRAAQEALERAGVGVGDSGPWVDEAFNVSPGGAISQSRPGSCVSACGEMLSGATKTEADLLEELGEWSTPKALAASLGSSWRETFFASGEDAVVMARRGPMGRYCRLHSDTAHGGNQPD